MSAPPAAVDRLRHRFREESAGEEDATSLLERLVREELPLVDGDAAREVVTGLHRELVGLGRLEELWSDPGVTDVLVNGPGPVWVERAGRLECTTVTLDGPALAAAIERVIGPLGLRADRAMPVADGRLADGSRLSVVMPPVAPDGPLLSIRRFAARPVPLADLAPPPAVALLTEAMEARANLVVYGGTGSGKTTLLNALCAALPETERVVTVEDAAELRLPLPHVVRLEARPPNAEGLGRVTVRDLVRAALRLRPDRIVVGEVRGSEAFDMVWAMSTGHDGSLSTCHAATAAEALERLETFVVMADAGLPFAVASRQVRRAVDVLVGVARTDGAAREVRAIHVVESGADDPAPLWVASGSRRRPNAVAR